MNHAPSARSQRRSALVHCALLLAACSAGVACSGSTAAKKDATGELKKRESARVRVALVAEREMVRTLETTTTVESDKEVKLFPRASGTVIAVAVEEGDAVAAGATLLEIDARSIQALVDEARVALKEAKNNATRSAIMESEAAARIAHTQLSWDQGVRDVERNEKANLISAQALEALRLTRDTAKNDLEEAKLALDRARVETKSAQTSVEKSELALARQELELSYTKLSAPFAGVIASRSVRVGDSISPASAVFVLTDAAHLRAVFYRPQRELALFRPAGTHTEELAAAAKIEIRATAEALPNVPLVGEILLVSPSIDAQSGSFRVTVHLAPAPHHESAGRLLPGMLVRLAIVTDRHPNALVVPKRALRREGESTQLYVVREGRARKVEIEEGFSDDADVEVRALHGALLALGEKVVVVGNRELEDGAEVELEGEIGANPAVPNATTPPAADEALPPAAAAPSKG